MVDHAVEGPLCDEKPVKNGTLENTETCDHDCTVPKCGDSVFNPLSAVPQEQCDEGPNNSDNENAFCTTLCQRRGSIAFITSIATFTGEIVKGQQSGIAAANAYCTEMAQQIPEIAAATPKRPIFAWLSTQNEATQEPIFSPSKSFSKCSTPYFLPKTESGERKLVALNYNDLTTKDLVNPLSTTETGAPAASPLRAITGTLREGEPSKFGDCVDFSSKSTPTQFYVRYGQIGKTDHRWSASADVFQQCDHPAHLYCFEQCPQ